MAERDERLPQDENLDDPLIAEAMTAYYAATPLPDPAGPARVMAALHRRRGIPVWWGALAAGVAGLVFAAGWTMGRRNAPDARVPLAAASSASVALEPVRFSLHAAGAHQVALVGAFNNWDASATPLVRNAVDGVWEVSVLLPPGLHVYSFVVDRSVWTVDPLAPRASDDFGTRNAVMLVRGGS